MSQTTSSRVLKEILKHENKKRAKLEERFFKTGKGEYGEGDIFLGLTVPKVRAVVGEYWRDASISDIEKLLKNKFHEVRLCALLLLVKRYTHAESAKEKRRYFELYTSHTRYINNWDLVDTSASQIVGEYMRNHMSARERADFIHAYLSSKDLWENRIIVVAAFYEIRNGDMRSCLYVAKRLIAHPHDLIHKSVGWMLREVGKRDRHALVRFLNTNAGVMPRTMLRYSLEHFSQKDRLRFMRMRKKKELARGE